LIIFPHPRGGGGIIEEYTPLAFSRVQNETGKLNNRLDIRSCIFFLGAAVGNIVALPVTGLLCRYGFDGGWPTVFYFFGKRKFA
jgi:hypothetical protein